jgi:hypothetical protein
MTQPPESAPTPPESEYARVHALLFEAARTARTGIALGLRTADTGGLEGWRISRTQGERHEVGFNPYYGKDAIRESVTEYAEPDQPPRTLVYVHGVKLSKTQEAVEGLRLHSDGRAEVVQGIVAIGSGDRTERLPWTPVDAEDPEQVAALYGCLPYRRLFDLEQQALESYTRNSVQQAAEDDPERQQRQVGDTIAHIIRKLMRGFGRSSQE